jgi:hypothetical protein
MTDAFRARNSIMVGMEQMKRQLVTGKEREMRIWRLVSRFGGLQGATSPAWQQPSPHEVQIGQRKQRIDTRRVLGQAAVTNLGKAPQAFDDVEGELAAGATARAAAIDRLLVLGQRFVTVGSPPVDAIANAGVS